MNTEYRSITLRTLTGDIRVASFEGRQHIVVPVVALVEGVIQAMNAPHPELVRAEAFSVAPSGWNGRPIFLNHPMNGNTPVSGNTPEILTRSLGRIFNSKVDTKRLLMEAWLDEERAKELGTEEAAIIERVRANKEVEISTGGFIILDHAAKGAYNGEKYQGAWEIIYPDHLAILSDGSKGACSYKMGCGVRAAADGKQIIPYRAEPRAASSPKREPGGSMSGMYKAMKEKVAELLGMMSPSEMGDTDLRNALAYALSQEESSFRYSGDIVTVYPNQSLVVYSMYDQEGISYYRRNYTLDSVGNATVSDDAIECERIVTFEPIEEPSEPLSTAMSKVVALAGARHSAKDKKMIQTMHDTAVSLGADCASITAASSEKPCGCHATALQPASW